MNIIVLIKPVPNPDFYSKISIDDETKRLIRAGVPTIINPSDMNALEFALKIREKNGGKVTIFSMAPMFNQLELEKCLSLGADEAYLVSDRVFGGADTYSTSYTLFKAIEKSGIKADLILAGNESADGATSHVPPQLGEWMNYPHISNISSINVEDTSVMVEKEIESGKISYKVELPALFSVHRDSNKPRLNTAYGIVAARDKVVNVYTNEELCLEEKNIGLVGSPTQPGEIKVLEMKRSSTELVGSEQEIARKIYDIINKAGLIKGGDK